MDASAPNHERLLLTLAAAHIGGWEWDVAGDRVRFLENVPDLLGIDPGSERTFEGFLEMAAPEDREKVRASLRAVLDDPAQRDVFQAEFRLAGNEARWISTKGRVFRNDACKPAHLTAVLMDVAACRRENETLLPGGANPARISSSSHVGHKLRTPLSEIIGLGELLLETALNEEQQEYVQTLLRSARSLVGVLGELSESISASSPSSVPKPDGRVEPSLPPPPPALFGRSLSVLLVEDTIINQQVLTLLLQRAGCRVQLALNGREALEALEREQFDLVLMDVQMPEMDGLRATRLIRAREKAVGGRVPVVAVTANAGQGERERCLAAGMDDYLSKPIRGADLVATIARLVGSVPARSSVEGNPPSSPRVGTEPAPGEDWLDALRSMRLEPPAIVRLVKTFLETTPKRLVSLRESLGKGDAPAVQAAAHSLKGSLAVFSARAAVAAARRLEELGRQARLADARAPLAELEAEMSVLRSAMSAFLERSP